MSYDLENMLLLLLSIKHTNSSYFVMQHLSYRTVGDLCAEAIRQGLIVESRKKFHLTEEGTVFIEKANDKLGRKGIDRFIAHLPGVIIEKISIEDIYLPDRI